MEFVVVLTTIACIQSYALLEVPRRAVWRFISDRARAGIVARGKSIGVDWYGEVDSLRSNMDTLQLEYDRLVNDPKSPKKWPEYYLKEFHAYEEGNLSWDAAFEVGPAALTVHAPIFTGSNRELRKDGDATLRSRYHEKMKEAFAKKKDFKPKRILDVGCSTGLSTLKLAESFPEAEIVGCDLSPFMLSVARFERSMKSGGDRVQYIYGAGENIDFMEDRPDLVAMCLVSHELPETAAQSIYLEAFNALLPGGAISIMDIDPSSAFFKKFKANRFAYAGFKSTEPWIEEYCEMDLLQRLAAAGFTDITVASNSPRHRTVVAYKP